MAKRSLKAGIEEKTIIENDSVYIINNPSQTNIYSIYLLEEIGDSKHYRDVFNLLREADEDEYFKLYLNNRGGYVHTGLDIMNAMKACKGVVLTCMTGACYSMAPLIVLTGDKVYVEEDSFMMFHDYSGGTAGKGNEIHSQIVYEKPHFDAMFRKITKGFLKESEIKRVLKGQDLYLGTEEVIKRLKKIGKLGNYVGDL